MMDKNTKQRAKFGVLVCCLLVASFFVGVLVQTLLSQPVTPNRIYVETFTVNGTALLGKYSFATGADYRSTAFPLNTSASVCWMITGNHEVSLVVVAQYDTAARLDVTGAELSDCFAIPSEDQWYFVIVNWGLESVLVSYSFTVWR